MPYLIASCTFNPPMVRIMGSTLKEETISKLNQKLFQVTTTAATPKKDPPRMQRKENPLHWVITLDGQYCDQLGRSMIFLTVVEALEGEDWKLKASNAIVHADSGMDSSNFIFFRE
eukprot:RCo049827